MTGAVKRDWAAWKQLSDEAVAAEAAREAKVQAVIAETAEGIDWTDAVKGSIAEFEAFKTELSGQVYRHAAELKLVDLAGDVNPSQVEMLVRSRTEGDGQDGRIWEAMLREARTKAEAAATFDPPIRQFANLAEVLAADLPATQYRVENLMIERGNLSLAAQYKSGKTTLCLNLVRALADGVPFLGEFEVRQLDQGRTVSYWDFELDPGYAADQARKLGIENTAAVVPEYFRGHSIPLTTDVAKEWAVNTLGEAGTDVWIIDPFAAVFQGDENSNMEVGEFLRALDEIKRKAGVGELVLVNHTGRSKEGPTRARGATRLDDWPDVRATWEIDGGNRKLQAHGRGVSQPGMTFEWDPATNLYSRLERQASPSPTDDLADRVFAFVSANPDSTTNAVNAGVTGDRTRVRATIAELVDQGVLVQARVGQANRVSVAPIEGL